MDPQSSPTSPGWIKPKDVMRVRKIKAKRKALQARMSNLNPLQILAPVKDLDSSSESRGVKRRNPFKCSPNKKQRPEDDDEITSDASLFRLLSPSAPKLNRAPSQAAYSFSNILKQQQQEDNLLNRVDETPTVQWMEQLSVDWSLKSRLRFKSPKPLPWKHNFKTSEEASGTTGFVRCLSSTSDESEDRTLDTSPNAQFYQCCLVWQYPNLPWLQLFPRDNIKSTTQTGLFGSDKKLADAIHAEWSESLRSLHQLLRVRQCPYFYVCGPTFTCLFRAAGVAGIPQAHALITPTTRGFREGLKNEDIEFEMPFHNNGSKNGGENSGDQSSVMEPPDQPQEDEEEEEEEEENEEAASWLKNLGVETSQFPNLNPNKVKLDREKFKNVDKTAASLVYVEGMETQGLINFLLNSRSCVATTGMLAGVPPTLLAPVAFQGGALKTLKTKGGMIRQDGDVQHSMEVSGPILPHTVHQLCSLLSVALDSYTVSLTPVPSTLPFSQHSHQDATAPPQAFAQEGLVDCGFDTIIRSLICNPSRQEEETKLPVTYREITFKDKKFTWIDKFQ